MAWRWGRQNWMNWNRNWNVNGYHKMRWESSTVYEQDYSRGGGRAGGR